MKEQMEPVFKVDPEFEYNKKNVEHQNRVEILHELEVKFSEILAESPIVVYTKHDNFTAEDNGIKFDKIKNAQTDETGTGGNIGVEFDNGNYVSVRKDGFYSSDYFDKRVEYYKLSKESFDNIVMMMNQLIERSGYSSEEKEKMMSDVVSALKEKVLSEEDLKNVKVKE